METSWRAQRLPWRALGGFLGAPGPVLEALGESWGRLWCTGGLPGGVLGGPGALLEVSKRCLGGSPGRPGAVLGALEAMLEPSGSQKAPKMEPKRVPNPALEAIPSENGKTLIFNDSTQDFNDFSCLRAPFWHQKWVQNGFRIASSMLGASERLLARILDAIIALLEPS